MGGEPAVLATTDAELASLREMVRELDGEIAAATALLDRTAAAAVAGAANWAAYLALAP